MKADLVKFIFSLIYQGYLPHIYKGIFNTLKPVL